jgi:hypothetical protein
VSAATTPTGRSREQVCKNILSSRVWRYRDVKDHWDELELRSWVRAPGNENGAEILYQEGSLGTILAADTLIDLVRARIKDERRDGLVIFSGTVPLVAGKIIYSSEFRCELRDPRSGRSLSCSYRAVPVEYLEGSGD